MTSFIAVLGDPTQFPNEAGATAILRQLGATVRSLDLWADPRELIVDEQDEARCIVIEAGARPDVAGMVLKQIRSEPHFSDVGVLLAVAHDQIGRVEPQAGFDDFILTPLLPAELYARVRGIEWRRSEFTSDERIKLGGIVIDRAGREATLSGALIALTGREFDLLVYLADHRGKVISRAELLRRVWGPSYDGGDRTIDIHVRRLRAKFGRELALETFRGAGYRLSAPR